MISVIATGSGRDGRGVKKDSDRTVADRTPVSHVPHMINPDVPGVCARCDIPVALHEQAPEGWRWRRADPTTPGPVGDRDVTDQGFTVGGGARSGYRPFRSTLRLM